MGKKILMFQFHCAGYIIVWASGMQQIKFQLLTSMWMKSILDYELGVKTVVSGS